MIKALEIDCSIDPPRLKKLARRYAMTGGFELVLKEGLSADELEQISNTFIAEVRSSDLSPARRRTANAYRVLDLIRSHPLVRPELVVVIQAAQGENP